MSIVALVLALSGTAAAAHHYLLSSTKQISPKVLAKLRGRTGPAGARGVSGIAGPAGVAGPAGSPGTAGAPGTTGGKGDKGDPGTPATTKRTVDASQPGEFNTAATSALAKVRDLGTFTKDQAGTVIRLTDADDDASPSGTYCTFQLRIDDANTDGSTSTGFGGFTGFEATLDSTDAVPVVLTGLFTGLGTGTHTVSLWAAATGSATCEENVGNFRHALLVEEGS